MRFFSVRDGTVLFRLTAGILACKEKRPDSLPDSTLAHKGEDEQQNETANDIGPLQDKSPTPLLFL